MEVEELLRERIRVLEEENAHLRSLRCTSSSSSKSYIDNENKAEKEVETTLPVEKDSSSCQGDAEPEIR